MRWHRMAKVDTATGRILAQTEIRAETLPEAFAQMREYTGASNSNELRFLGYVEGLSEPQTFACECEHARHYVSESMRTQSGAHGPRDEFLVLYSVQTVHGTYHVCESCTECVAPYLTSTPVVVRRPEPA